MAEKYDRQCKIVFQAINRERGKSAARKRYVFEIKLDPCGNRQKKFVVILKFSVIMLTIVV